MTKAISLLRAAFQPAARTHMPSPPAPVTRDEIETLFGDLLAR